MSTLPTPEYRIAAAPARYCSSCGKPAHGSIACTAVSGAQFQPNRFQLGPYDTGLEVVARFTVTVKNVCPVILDYGGDLMGSGQLVLESAGLDPQIAEKLAAYMHSGRTLRVTFEDIRHDE
mgnify:CR=1 FL=1